MTSIQYIPDIDKFFIRWQDGSKGWANLRALKNIYPNRNWQIVIANPGQIFYL